MVSLDGPECAKTKQDPEGHSSWRFSSSNLKGLSFAQGINLSLDLSGCIYNLSKWFYLISFLHVLCDLNKGVDVQVNKGVALGFSELRISDLAPCIVIPP